jgi:hypothetical protein
MGFDFFSKFELGEKKICKKLILKNQFFSLPTHTQAFEMCPKDYPRRRQGVQPLSRKVEKKNSYT